VTGQTIKNYTFSNILGKGGMATVYLATDKKFQTNVAVKVLNKEFIHNENIRQRFLAEARNMFRMSHPNVIKVTDLIDDGDLVAFVMDYIEGPTLKDYLDTKSSLSDQEIKQLFSQMLAAVGYVHEQGMVHRDIKPSNFIINKKGEVKLLDFGIAKNTELTAAEYTLTSTTQNMGTPMYMSPEQIKSSKDVQARSDIYSLGVVLWQMVTRRKPYDAQTLSTFDIQSKIVNEPLSFTGTGWDAIIKKATQKEISNRYPDINSFLQAVKVLDIESDRTQLLQQDADSTIIDKQTIYSRPIISDKIMNYCTRCGKENPATAKFCTSCGVALVSDQQPSIQSKNNSKIIIISLSILIAAMGCYFIFFNKKGKPDDTTINVIGTDSASINQIIPFVPKSLYSMPDELLYAGKREKEAFPGPLYPGFFPIGWSRNGKFAYVEEPVDESCGCYFFKIYIQDMNSDKILWQWNFEGQPDDGMDFKKIWKKNGAMFTEKLNFHQISSNLYSGLEKPPLVFNNIECTFAIDNTPIYSNDYEEARIAATTISMKTNGIERKKIFNKKYTYTGYEEPSVIYSNTLSNKILGYLKNPFENRVALFYITETRGWEGPPNVIDFEMIGCDLNYVGLH
jgi:serine/threonine protein kinase